MLNYEKRISFDEFKQKLGIRDKHKVSQRSTEEIIEDVHDIINMFGGDEDYGTL